MGKALIFFSFAIATLPVPAYSADLDLEPCINGSVSGSGMYISYQAEAEAQDPCLNGEVLPRDRVVRKLFEPSRFSFL